MSVKDKLDHSRKELLDLGMRNSMLNYRKLRARGVEVIEKDPQELFRTLVVDEKRVHFLALPELEVGGGQDGEFALASPPKRRHSENALQTAEKLETLQTRLRRTYDAARTSIEEHGVNSLYLALGMLKWQETAGAELVRLAPLILIPVSIERASIKEKFTVAYNGDEIAANVSLVEKLKAEFSLVLPALPTIEDLDVLAYFDIVDEAISGQSKWSIDRSAIALGFFSFAKYQIFQDLDTSLWPDHAKPEAHPILSCLLEGQFNDTPNVHEYGKLDEHIASTNLVQVLDADASQTVAMLAVKSGSNLVIQGPPGTGKSQTITNLIADAVADGKRVLFVAEKAAALNVVQAKLKHVELDYLCLELHSNKSNKREVLAEIQRTFDLARPKVVDSIDQQDAGLLTAVRNQLNDYCRSLHTPVVGSVTPYVALSGLSGLKERGAFEILKGFQNVHLAALGDEEFHTVELALAEYTAALVRIGRPMHLPFLSTTRDSLSPVEEAEGVERIRRADKTLLSAIELRNKLLGFGIDPGPEQGDTHKALDLAKMFVRSEGICALNLSSVLGVDDQELFIIIEKIGMRIALEVDLAKLVKPDALFADLRLMESVLRKWNQRWWRIFSPSYRESKRAFLSLCHSLYPPRSEWLSVVAQIHKWRETALTITESKLMQSQFRTSLQDTPMPGEWIKDLETFLKLRGPIGRTPPLLETLHNSLCSRGDGEALLTTLRLTTDAEERAWEDINAVRRLYGMGGVSAPRDGKESALSAERRWLGAVAAEQHKFRDFLLYRRRRNRLVELGLEPLLTEAEAAPIPLSSTDLLAPLHRERFLAIAHKGFQECPTLRDFTGAAQMDRITEFAALDEQLIRLNRLRTASAHHAGMVHGYGTVGEMAVLRAEWQKKKRHLPVRSLLQRAGGAVQRIKPIFMMSPMSVATYLKPGALEFDLVIFDEASQVKPIDAFGALLRGKQAVVVGDSKQLPPTSFFERMTGDDEPDGEDDAQAAAQDMESILALFEARNAPSRMLCWHYRSRHHSLVTVSNNEFYQGRLKVFVSAEMPSDKLGLRFHHLPQAVYDRGGTRSNPLEAEAVAKRVMEIAKAGNGLSLGVAAFSQAQREEIEDSLERLRQKDPALESFFNVGNGEPFFVKNLENVQGDERDIILISIGYGRTGDGRFPLNFGPLNRDGGERRLNVLITRARRLCEVFANFRPEEMNLGGIQAVGLRALKRYLEFAESGRSVSYESAGSGFDSPFEECVYKRLVSRGYDVHSQIGCRGFSIDLAVVHPERPGCYVLGIECDGATYHSAQWARDRDRLRQTILEGLGWKIHRVWSSDWWANPEREIDKIVAAVDKAKGDRVSDSSLKIKASPSEPLISRAATNTRKSQEEQTYNLESYKFALVDATGFAEEFHLTPTQTLAEKAFAVIDIESPVHVSEVLRRIVQASGTQRLGSRVQTAIEDAIEALIDEDYVCERGEFLWKKGHIIVAARSRANLPQIYRKIETISPEEIDIVILGIARSAISIDRANLEVAVLNALGFGRASSLLRAGIGERIDQLVSFRSVSCIGGIIRVVDEKAQ